MLVTGSLSLLADLAGGGRDKGWCTMARVSGRLGVLTFAVAIILIVVAVSYAAGYVLGKMVL